MHVVVPCPCGVKFSFDVEPVDGKLPKGAELTCPSCQRDGVPLANQAIERELSRAELYKKTAPPPTPPRKAVPRPTDTPAPAKKKFSLFKKKEKEDDGSWTEEDLQREREDIYTGPNKVKGRIGALSGALLGTFIWFTVSYVTGLEFRWIALLVGVLVGFGSRWIGGGRDYHLGVFAGTCALCAILTGQIMATHFAMQDGAKIGAAIEYAIEVAKAKKLSEAKTDGDYKKYLAAQKSTLVVFVNPNEILDEEVVEFKANELPRLQQLAAGEPTREAFILQKSTEKIANTTFRDVFNESFSPYLFFWLFLGAGMAWKLASDSGTSIDTD